MAIMKEAELFQYLKDSHYPDLVKSEGTYDTFDCITEQFKMYIELKSRRTHYPTLLIEKVKYDNLILAAGARQLAPWYINSTPEGVWAFHLTPDIEIPWSTQYLPVTTDFANKSKIDKMVGFLPLEAGVQLDASI